MAGSAGERHRAFDQEVEAFLERDTAWGAYLLADLCQPMREHTRFFLGADALLCVHEPPEFKVICSMGSAAGVAALLDGPSSEAELPARAALVLELGHRAAFEARYRVSSWDPMSRMILEEPKLPPPRDDARLLAPADLPSLTALLAERSGFTPFTAEMLRYGVYAGVRLAGELVAVAGTHVVAAERRVAALGNVYCAPAHRGRGLAGAATALVIEELLARGCDRVVLNVAADNAAAIALYRRLGFAEACPFWEVPEAERR